MFAMLHKTTGSVALMMAAAAWAIGWGNASVYAQHSTGQHGGHAGQAAQPAHQQPSAHAGHDDQAAHGGHDGHDQALAAPHGGQVTTVVPTTFEVLYLPQEIRVYLYGPLLEPRTAKDVAGEIALQLRNDQRTTRLTLHYAEAPRDEQDYLSAPVNMSRVKNGTLTATVKLKNLPDPDRPEISFVQPVVMSQAKPQVVLAAIDASDQAGIARQRVCPVTGAPLDSMGGPVKVLVGEHPLYLCCEGCLGKVKSDPNGYLQKASHAAHGQ